MQNVTPKKNDFFVILRACRRSRLQKHKTALIRCKIKCTIECTHSMTLKTSGNALFLTFLYTVNFDGYYEYTRSWQRTC